ncbi:putative transcriptional regulatory protein [Colletotrichum gloeosporioides]|uniref:Putative transcriptional regulatory protein n=1 Tax=Colletotrichum gloeosporioides TaxID=474922 RepID=A0A8H4FPI0_COLGL|nr:putative transcriptional regulatory protein [Colletotrichum gloeosporioides]KAF3809675.1 putative transcriptional regulatory protein [Colletotrichum gloeosporioides]
MTQAVKRACDACHRRKVKCDGVNPCRNCHTAQLSCTYNAIPQKKGPKGSRAKVISELRETQRQTSLSAKVQNRMNGMSGPPGPVSLAPTPGLLSSELVKECIDFYFANLYEKMPILDRHKIEQQLPYMERDPDTYCLLTSLCAFMMLQPGMSMPAGDPFNLDVMPGAAIVATQLLLEETLQVRKGYDYLTGPSEGPTFNTLATNFFIYGCYHGMEMHNKAWYYLREASTMMHMSGMTKEETYRSPQWDNAESSRRRRLYWLFYVMERAHAIQHQRPLTLQATIQPPNSADDPSDPLSHQLNSFIMLVNLFHPFDDAFTAVWNKTRSNLYVSNLQKQLNEVLPTYLCQDGQLSDLRTNQQWLKTTVWQLTHGSMNSQNEESMNNFQYPVDLSREMLMNLASHFPGQGMELMGSGLIEKLFQITCNMTDFLAVQPAARDPFTVGPREQLNQTLNIVAVLRHSDFRFLPLLLNKVADIMPRLTNPMLQNAPENANLGAIDIFDGFGNAGMAQPPQMQMQMDTDYDRKFSVADYDKKYGMSDMNSNVSDGNVSTGAPSVSVPATTADMNSPFASSPAIMSPPMEYPHNGMNDYGCAQMPDMVMSPMGQNGSSIGGSNQHQQHQSHHMLQNQGMNQQQMQPNMNQHHNHNMQQSQNMGSISPPSFQGQQQMNAPSIPTSHPMGPGGNNLMNSISRQQPQRANSYAIPQQPLPRTVGETFHALQRANSDMPGMTGMPAEMDFNTLR